MSNYYNRQWRLPNNENKDKQSNYSMDFDGSNYIDVGNPTELQFGDEDFSITSWFKMSTSQSNNLVGKFEATGNQRSYSIWIDESGSGFAKFVISNNGQSGSGNTTVVTDNNSLSLNNWHFVAVVYDSTNNLAKISIDANSFVTSSHSGGAYSSSTANFRISNINGLFFDGQIDAVSIYNYALSASQVTTLYGSSSTGIGNPMTLNPVAYYPLGDQDSFNGANYLVPNSSLKDYVFNFDGTNDYITLGSTISLNGELTISMWLNPNDNTIVNLLGNSNNTNFLYINGSNQLQISSSDIAQTFTNTTFSTGSWQHIILTRDSSNVFKAYKNGTLTDTSSADSGTFTFNQIGTYYTGQFYFNGKMSNVQVFNTALPATGSNSVETLYNYGSPLTSMTGFTSLVSWYKLNASDTYDSSTGNWTIEDHAGSNDGTSSGMTQSALQQSDLSFKTSYSPYALDFDGTNDSISLNSDISLTGNKTVSFWFKASNITGNNVVIGGNQSPTTNYYPYITSTGICLRDSTGYICLSGLTFNNDEWYHLCIVGDGTTATVYINGQSQGTLNDKNPTINTIGAFSNSASPFTGSLSNVSVWNAALSSSQVLEIYNEGVPSNLNNHSAYSNLVSWWQLGSNTSWVDPYWIALDEKGTNNGQSQNVAAPNNMGENAIVDGVGSYANGLSSGMGGDEVVGDAPYSSSNSLSVNMDVLDRTTDTPS